MATAKNQGHFVLPSKQRDDSKLSPLNQAQNLSVQELFFHLKEADKDQWLNCLQTLSSPQVQGLIDIDCWNGDYFRQGRFELYFKSLCLLDYSKLGHHLRFLERELWALGLRHYIQCFDLDHDNPPNHIPEEKLVFSLDQKYYLVLKDSKAENKEMLQLFLNKASAYDINLCRRLLEDCKVNSFSELNEDCYRVKKNRLLDSGFEDYSDAVQIYSHGEALALKEQLLKNPLKKVFLHKSSASINLSKSISLNQKTISDNFFSEVIQTFQEQEEIFNEINREYAATLNAALVADQVIHRSLAEIHSHNKQSHNYINLGLLYLSEANKEKAKELIKTQAIKEIFRLGWLLIDNLNQAALKVKSGFQPKHFSLIDKKLLNALKGRHLKIPTECLNDLMIQQNEELFLPELDSLQKIGKQLATLSTMTDYLVRSFDKQLKLTTSIWSQNENIFVRLSSFVFLLACQEKDFKRLSEDAFMQMAKKYNAKTAAEVMQKIVEKAPADCQNLLKSRLQDAYQSIAHYLDNNSSTQTIERQWLPFFSWDIKEKA